MLWAACILGAYLVGSIPFGLLIGLSRGIDIRTAGSGNVGATNVARLLGRKVGVACFFLDAAKGAGPVVVAGMLGGLWGRPLAELSPSEQHQVWLWLAVAAAALLGHMFSPWLGFKGGKGVATGFGGLLGMWPLLTVPAALALLVWLIVVRATRYISLASMTAALSLPLTSAALSPGLPIIVTTSALAVLVIYKHRANIGRLRAGTEPRMGEKRGEGKGKDEGQGHGQGHVQG